VHRRVAEREEVGTGRLKHEFDSMYWNASDKLGPSFNLCTNSLAMGPGTRIEARGMLDVQRFRLYVINVSLWRSRPRGRRGLMARLSRSRSPIRHAQPQRHETGRG
jgi:hypothetical protein